jgi:hypothetical protein
MKALAGLIESDLFFSQKHFIRFYLPKFILSGGHFSELYS